jgi:hypothetical protein
LKVKGFNLDPTRGRCDGLSSKEDFTPNGVNYPAGSYVVLLAQPYGGFAKTLLERQEYPDLREGPKDDPEIPYDVPAHTLPSS